MMKCVCARRRLFDGNRLGMRIVWSYLMRTHKTQMRLCGGITFLRHCFDLQSQYVCVKLTQTQTQTKQAEKSNPSRTKKTGRETAVVTNTLALLYVYSCTFR